ncbi:MAG: hypothetical protein NW206_20945 [Hyphomonadaceae bacterium]|nr:hypothetical protein [Hyphomonadaceae bacterium]
MTTTKIAAEFAPGSDMVQLVDKGIITQRADAVAMGYTVSAAIVSKTPPVPASGAPVDGRALKKSAWRAAIIGSPEAKGRDNATAELLTKHSPETLSVDDAQAFLRGLPTEQPERIVSNVTTNPDPRAARIAEINGSVGAYNKSRGFAARAQVAAPQSIANIEPSKLKRLAELRLNALDTAQAHGADGEAKKLRYALQVHDTTALPLSSVFNQLGVDTSKIIR